jgi:hypothetical protein
MERDRLRLFCTLAFMPASLARHEHLPAPPRRRGPEPCPATSFEYNLRHNPPSNLPNPSTHNNLVSVIPGSVPMGSSDGIKEALEKLTTTLDKMQATQESMRVSLDKLAPLAPLADQLAVIPAKVTPCIFGVRECRANLRSQPRRNPCGEVPAWGQRGCRWGPGRLHPPHRQPTQAARGSARSNAQAAGAIRHAAGHRRRPLRR